MERIAWHPAFVEAIQLELEEYRDFLEFMAEYQLTSEPLQMDVLIVKKISNIKISKNIGQIFQKYNVIEYKSPEDYASVSDYNKTQSYSRLYASQTGTDTNDMSVTIVVTKRPRKLLKYLSVRFIVTKEKSAGYLLCRG
ncbi:MAG: hypothetical protein LBT89_11900 [Planctomycetaceae bacterium]|jgi:hypothetical protein|nr:hypothetical protein [Planctomycetaceae bacterium]